MPSPMRILANENISADVVDELRRRDHDVIWARVDMPGSSDREVLQRTESENRTLLTFDKDFGELAFRVGLAASSGIVLLRIRVSSPAHVVQMVVTALESRPDWVGQFAVVEEGRIRTTRSPAS